MKCTLVVCDTPQPVAGIQFFPLDVSVVSFDFAECRLKSESRKAYVKRLAISALDGLEHPSDAQWYVIDIDLPDNRWIGNVEEIAQQWLQLRVFCQDLTTLREKTKAVSPGWTPWAVNKALGDLSKRRSELTQIRQIATQLDTHARWRSYVSDVLNLIDSLKDQNEAHQAIVEARKARVDLALVIFGIVVSVVLALVLT